MNGIELIDCHTHTVFSDGGSTLAKNMDAALHAGITTIACTDHWGKPEFVDCSIKESELSTYFNSVVALREQYPSLEIVLGLEADWYPGCEKDLTSLREQNTANGKYHPKKKPLTGTKILAYGKN